MSIFCTLWMTADGDHDIDTCAKWVRCHCDEPYSPHTGMTWKGDDGHGYLDGSRSCTCGAGPIVYRQSHRVPNPGHRQGWVEVGYIASHIGADNEYRDDPDETHLPYLRMTACAQHRTEKDPDTVVLDRSQVSKLRDALTWFLDNCDEELAADVREVPT